MKLQIEFPDNLITEQLLAQKEIPCRCRVEIDFNISFSDTNPGVTGMVLEWDREALDLRVPRYIGGTASHDSFGVITLKGVGPNLYEIVDLEVFNRGFGWCPVIAAGEYAPPGEFWDEDDGR